MKKIIIFILVSLFVNGNIIAQKTNVFFGRVFFKCNDYPFKEVSIIMVSKGKAYETIADANGSFSFKDLPLGSYSIFTFLNNICIDEKIGFELSDSSKFIGVHLGGEFLEPRKPISRMVLKCYAVNRNYNSILIVPNSNINMIAAYKRGVDSRNGEVPSIRGARPENTAYYLDGVRISNPLTE
jgi:hypothetical protein